MLLSARIEVSQPPRRSGDAIGRSHSLWYCNAFDRGHYDWYELAFAPSVFSNWPLIRPYALEPTAAGIAFENVVGTEQLNGPITRLDPTEPETLVVSTGQRTTLRLRISTSAHVTFRMTRQSLRWPALSARVSVR